MQAVLMQDSCTASLSKLESNNGTLKVITPVQSLVTLMLIMHIPQACQSQNYSVSYVRPFAVNIATTHVLFVFPQERGYYLYLHNNNSNNKLNC